MSYEDRPNSENLSISNYIFSQLDGIFHIVVGDDDTGSPIDQNNVG